MAMRTECKQYESRTYANGDTVRKCNLDLAPEAPWRCPEDCPKFEPRAIDFGWSHGTFVPDGGHVPEPTSLGDDESIGDLLDAAEAIVNSAGPRILGELEDEKKTKSRLSRLRKKNRKKKRRKK
jgi:hypothetical protein